MISISAQFRYHWAFCRAAKVTLSAMLTTLVVTWLHTPSSFFAVLTAIVVSLLFPQEIIHKSVERFTGSFLGVLTALFAIYTMGHVPWLFFISLCLLLFIPLYLTCTHQAPYLSLFWGGIFICVAVMGYHSHIHALLVSKAWLLSVFLGCAIAILVEKIIWRTQPEKLSRECCAAFIHYLIRLEEDFYQEWADTTDSSFKVKKEKLMTYSSLMNHCQRAARYLKDEKLGLFHARLRQLQAIYFIMQDRQMLLSSLPEQEDIDWQPFHADVLLRLRTVLPIIESPISVNEEFLSADYLAFVKKIEAISDQKRAHLQLALLEKYQAISQRLQNFSKIPPDIISSGEKKTKIKIYWDKEAAKQALKAALAPLLIAFSHLGLGFPDELGTFQGIIAATIIAGQPNLGRSWHRFVQRFTGIVIGGMLGAVLLLINAYTPSLFYYLTLAMAYFALAFFVIYQPKHEYAGFQAAIVIPMIVLYQAPHMDPMHLAYIRLAGVFYGASVAGLVLYFIWPQHPQRLLKKHALSLCNFSISLMQDISETKTREHYQSRVIADQLAKADEYLTDLLYVPKGHLSVMRKVMLHLTEILLQLYTLERIAMHTQQPDWQIQFHQEFKDLLAHLIKLRHQLADLDQHRLDKETNRLLPPLMLKNLYHQINNPKVEWTAAATTVALQRAKQSIEQMRSYSKET